MIGRTVKFPDATVAAEPITTYASATRAPTAYRQLARELDRPRRGGLTDHRRPGDRPRPAQPPRPEHPTSRPAASSPGAAPATPFEVHLDNFTGPVRPAARPDHQAQARHHRDRARPGHRRVHRAHPGRSGPTPTWDLGAGPRVPARRGDAARPQGRPAAAADRAARTRRTSPCSRRATCCSPGCCSTAPSRRSRTPSRERMATAGRMHPRAGSARAARSPRCCPSWSWAITPEQLADDRGPRAGAQGGARRVGLEPPARARGQRARAGRRSSSTGCAASGSATFRALVADADSTLVVVARFLALLELFREAAIAFDQAEALGELTVRWTGSEEGEIEVERRVRRADDRATTRRTPTPEDDRSADDVSSSTESDRTRARRRRGRRPTARAEEQLAFDVDDFPGGARGAIEAVLMVVDEPVDRRRRSPRRSSCRSTTSRPRSTELEAEYAAQHRGFTLRQVGGRLADLQPRRLRAGGRAVRPRRPAGPAHPGRAGDAGRHRLPPAGRRGRASRGPRRQRRRRRPHAAHPRPHRGARRTTRESARSCTARPSYFLQRLGLSSLDELPALAPYLPEVDVLDEIAEGGRG